MQRIFLLSSLLLCFVFSLSAQQKIDAESIIADLDAGKDISISNAVIMGDLRLIDLQDRQTKGGDWGKQEKVLCHVRNRLSFDKCEFRGQVLGYFSEGSWNKKNQIHIDVDFHEAVSFTNCDFKEGFKVKYSRFDEDADFSGSIFRREGLFKYTKFEQLANFSNTRHDEANFKYTEFEELADFSGARFEGEANFKYTDFEGDLDLTNTAFTGSNDFKYVKFPRDTKMDGVEFSKRSDFKYAKLGREDFRGK
ncbi:hypothetical protein CEQ90_05910 [Lewinellaceae bacterium SD302]|nr:hypothetical protein CEQ90_05910 [Lewinellaceae bacterium SD302]